MALLDGKVAVVTGAGQGIGRAHALALAAEGATVVVNDIGGLLDGSGATSDPAAGVVADIEAAGGTAVANADDVATWDGAENLVRQAVDTFGRLDILVNNAGILRDKMSFNMSEQDWDDVIRVHLKGHFAPSRFAVTYWREQSKAGNPIAARIINTSSESGLFGNPGQANYAAAKGGIASLTLVLARELSRLGGTANAIAPRARTRMTEGLMKDLKPDEETGFDPLAPENISPLVVWLGSDDAAHVSGQIFVLWGGTIQVVRGWQIIGTVSTGENRAFGPEELTSATEELFSRRDPGVPAFGVPMAD